MLSIVPIAAIWRPRGSHTTSRLNRSKDRRVLSSLGIGTHVDQAYQADSYEPALQISVLATSLAALPPLAHTVVKRTPP